MSMKITHGKLFGFSAFLFVVVTVSNRRRSTQRLAAVEDRSERARIEKMNVPPIKGELH